MTKETGLTTCPAHKKAKSAVMQPKYRMQVVESKKSYQRKKDKQQTRKTLRSEGFLFQDYLFFRQL